MKPNFKSLEFIYQDTQIHFLFSQNENVMVNATDMAKAFGKRVDDFTRLETTEKYIVALLKFFNHADVRDYNVADVPQYKKEDIISSNKKRGTFMHRFLALKFAMWLDVDFEIWIIKTIDQLLFGNAKNLGSKITEVENNKQKIADLKNAIIQSGNETALQFLETIENLKKTEYQKKKAFAQFSNQFKLF